MGGPPAGRRRVGHGVEDGHHLPYARAPTKVEDVDEDEDLGFDPFGESQRGLEDLLRGETGCESQPDPIYRWMPWLGRR
jgi:hypothetical protein